jgi:hypothetical protein
MNSLPKGIKSFAQLLQIAGFVTSGRGFIGIDKQRALAFLYCDLSTLNRWLRSNNPCKRAVKLLLNRERTLPDEWEGFQFSRRGELVHAQFKNPVSAKTLLSVPYLFRDNSDKETSIKQYQQLVNEMSDSSARHRAIEQIQSSIKQLELALIDTYLMQDDKIKRRVV